MDPAALLELQIGRLVQLPPRLVVALVAGLQRGRVRVCGRAVGLELVPDGVVGAREALEGLIEERAQHGEGGDEDAEFVLDAVRLVLANDRAAMGAGRFLEDDVHSPPGYFCVVDYMSSS